MTDNELHEFRRLFQVALQQFDSLLDTCSACCGMTMARSAILFEIGQQPAMSLNDLAARVGLEKSTVSRHVQRLVEDGLITRQASASDRRSVTLSLTKKGRAVEGRIAKITDEYIVKTFDAVPHDRLRVAKQGLETITNAMRQTAFQPNTRGR